MPFHSDSADFYRKKRAKIRLRGAILRCRHSFRLKEADIPPAGISARLRIIALPVAVYRNSSVKTKTRLSARFTQRLRNALFYRFESAHFQKHYNRKNFRINNIFEMEKTTDKFTA